MHAGGNQSTETRPSSQNNKKMIQAASATEPAAAKPAVVLVTGGSGLVGRAIEAVVSSDKDPRFARRDGEQWVFLTSKDGDLR